MRIGDVRVDAPLDVPLSSLAMNPRKPGPRPLAFLAALLALAIAGASTPALAQSWGVGVGGALVDDVGNEGKPSGTLESSELHAFAELWIEPGTYLQIRYARLELPGTVEGSPEVRVNAAEVTASYLFREEWWEGGFFGGIGGYRLDPCSPEGEQVVVDEKEDAFGLTGGLLMVVRVMRNFDVRVEGRIRWIAADVERTPISIGASLAYRF